MKTTKFQSLIGTIKTVRNWNYIEYRVLVSIPYRDDKNLLQCFIANHCFVWVSIPYRDDKNKIKLGTENKKPLMFQSLIGTIKTIKVDLQNGVVEVKFQSLIGTIKTSYIKIIFTFISLVSIPYRDDKND